MASLSREQCLFIFVDVDEVLVGADKLGDIENTSAKTSVTTRSTSVIPSIAALPESSRLSSDTPAHYHTNLPPSPSHSSFEKDLRLLNPASTWIPVKITIHGRRLDLPHAHDGVFKSTFPVFCVTCLGPVNYVSLCSTFDTISSLTSLH
ncbi:uncharacterized protein Z519_08193 [Cladophialophora bantiana CBS 173.52]|uniref:Uncharacterized protein n=1 Tax=Cladophialophora bantiana (strain ATCC 10958 / CBS 173.52 / CDC B-1940 / NIH 8579) TaxID=1442370 RepID=A0A0D2FXT9_CLAB1|nr:uncharacterized protein Z519_08193 [Cladophialophora bantiana CBS 173.52]KIW91297.1 hypothetical protein Z519_08193 [Cladophialophora bantiana CBS 173.52]